MESIGAIIRRNIFCYDNNTLIILPNDTIGEYNENVRAIRHPVWFPNREGRTKGGSLH